MIDFSLDTKTGILHVRPMGPLGKGDFDNLAATVDPFIEKEGRLRGLVIEIARFPGWEDFGAAVRHFRFVRDHHRKVEKVAVVTDSFLGTLAESLASQFVAAEVRHFDAHRLDDARMWVAAD